MRDSLSLQLSLFRRQKAQIAEAVESQSQAFRAYEARYRRATSKYEQVVETDEIHDRLRNADIVYVGDYHTLRSAQDTFIELVNAARKSKRRVVLALEFVEGKQQALLNRYLRGEVSERRFLSGVTLHPLWEGFRPIFELARRHRLEVVAIDSRPEGPRALGARDAFAAERIATAADAPDCPRVLVLMGQYHIARQHLPAMVRERAPSRKPLIVFQNCEGIYWSLARKRRINDVRAVRIRESEYCLLHTSPVVCQQSFLDYVEGETTPLLQRGSTERFRDMCRVVAKFAGVEVSTQLEEVEVLMPGDLELFERLRRRGAFTSRELTKIRRHLLSRESCYIPRARAVYLASSSLSHAAEEAAHWVRHCAVGSAMERPRPSAEAFHARCLEEALGFFGSKLVDPTRQCTRLPEWARVFQTGKASDRAVAAFVLALEASASEGVATTNALLPLGEESVFLAVSHALGYLLGEALFEAFERGRLSRLEIQGLFRNPFDDPGKLYRTLCQKHRRTRGAVVTRSRAA